MEKGLYAPKFEIVEKPNDFIKTGKIQASSGEMNKSQSERLAFWTRFNEVIIERGRPFNVRKASTDHWYDVAIGTSAAHLGITLVNKENCIGIELYISDDKSIFDRLYAEKDVIEKELGLTLDWQRLDGKKASRIVYRIDTPISHFQIAASAKSVNASTIAVKVKFTASFMN